MEEILQSKERLESKTLPNSVRKRKEQQIMDEKIASCSEDHSSDADSDKSNAEDTIVIVMRNKKKILRKRKRPQRTGIGVASLVTAMSESDDAIKDESLKKSRCGDMELFSENSEVEKNMDEPEKVVVDTLDRVKQEAIAMDQPVGVDQQVPSTTSALLAQRTNKDVSAAGSSRKYSLAAQGIIRTTAESGESSHDEDDSDIVGAVTGGENASTVTSELGKNIFNLHLPPT